MAAKNDEAGGLGGGAGLREHQDCGLSEEYTALASQINAEYELAVGKARESLEHKRRCGQMLLQIKAAVGHGAYRAWIKANCVFTHRTAERFTRLVKNWQAITDKSDTVSPLTMRGALRLIASEGKSHEDHPGHHDHVHDDDVRDRDRDVQVQILACLFDAWDEATPETRVNFFGTLHGRGEFMPTIERSVRRGVA